MAAVTWGMLAKSQTDPQTIEQRIIELIAEHNENEEAHLGVGQSLQSHKAAEIIDHLVDSIVADKIKEREVTTDKLADFARSRFSVQFESLDAWEVVGAGIALDLGIVRIARLVGDPNTIFIYSGTLYPISWTKNFIAQFVAKFINFSANEMNILTGSWADDLEEKQNAGFVVTGGNLYAHHRSWISGGGVDVNTLVPDIVLNNYNVFRVQFYYGSRFEFYVNDVLVAVHPTSLPNPDFPSALFSFGLVKTDSINTSIYIHHPYIALDI